MCVLLTVCIVAQTVPAIVFAEEPSTAVVSKLQVEYQDNPIGLDTSAPRFSWIIEDTVRGQLQTAYQIRVATSKSGLATGPYVWDSGKVNSLEQNGIEYAGDALQPATVYYWNVTI